MYNYEYSNINNKLNSIHTETATTFIGQWVAVIRYFLHTGFQV